MVPDLINYKVSFLNPLAKMIVPIIFLLAAFLFFKARKQYGGELGKVVTRLAIACVIGFLAMSVRYAGDILIVWKWGESLGMAALGVANIYAIWPLIAYVREMQAAERLNPSIKPKIIRI